MNRLFKEEDLLHTLFAKGGYYIDETANGNFRVSWHEKTLIEKSSMQEALIFLLNRVLDKK